MARFPLGGQLKGFDSKKSRETLINLIAETSKDGQYRTARRVDGLTHFVNLPQSPVRSDLLVNDNKIYVVAGNNLYRVDIALTVEDLGIVGGTGRARLSANSVPGDSQILVLNGSGSGFIYDNANGLVSITDPDFFPSSWVTILDERFWLTRDNTNEFFGSAISDGTIYDPLTFGSAEEAPDDVVAVVAKKSALWVLGSETSQYFQSFNDATFPLRPVKGATKEWGILAKDSLAEINDSFAFLADDRTVRMVQGTNIVEISDLDFQLKVKGNGTATSPGFDVVEDAIGFFVDGPVHSIYYLTFPSEGFTWGYDLNSGMTHIRETEGQGRWRVNGATKFGSKIVCGDSVEGRLWVLDPNNYTEGGNTLRTTLITPSLSTDRDITIPLIEIEQEVAQTSNPVADPQQIVKYSKDGGYTYINKGTVSLGKIGQYNKRVPLRQFGRLVRNQDFLLRLEVTDPVGVQYYGANFFPSASF